MKVQETSEILDKLYPLVKSKLENSNIERKFIAHINSYMNKKHQQIHDIAPYTNILYNKGDVDNLFESINIDEGEVLDILEGCWFFDDPNIRPKCCKEPYCEVLLCAIRYYIETNNSKLTENVTIYTLFTGKFYASLYSSYWKFAVQEPIMDYVVNNMMTDKFDLKKEGTIYKAIKKLAITWISKYKAKIKSDFNDDDCKNHLQQLRDREKSFLGNVYTLYLDAAYNKLYLNYETDSLNPDDFRITDNDANKASRIVEATMNKLTSTKIDMDACDVVAAMYNARSIKASQIRYVIESIILGDTTNLNKVRRVLEIFICTYMAENPGKPIYGEHFISEVVKPKPNTKDKLLLEMKTIIIDWLNQDETYRRRAKTNSTAVAYQNAILAYFAIIVNQVAIKI